MEQQLTEYQAEFVTRIKSRVSSGELVVYAFNKIGEEDTSTYNTFKIWLFEFCMANDIYFHESRYFIIAGLTKEVCEEFETHITKKTANTISRLLHNLKMLDTVKNVN